ncbi:hypothetical protein [Microbulbifer epialgicus]|uniref:Uncharacterized protein n=1 Tax=Microbulbifer epialgicus TaxID=393907 RepID=A0ABV4NTM5_9GAMM
MGNYVIVKNDKGQKIGSMNLSLDCFAIVNQITVKYTGSYLPLDGDINTALKAVYSHCEKHEEIMLLLFINEKSTFDRNDMPHFEKALSSWEYSNQNPKKFLSFILGLLRDHESVSTEYSGVSTSTISVTS